MSDATAKREWSPSSVYGIQLRTRVSVGEGVAVQAASILRDLRATRVLVVTDVGVERAGVLEPLLAQFHSIGLDWSVFREVEPDPAVATVHAAAAAYQEAQADAILAVGGGSVLDVGKGVRVLVTRGGDIRAYAGQQAQPILAPLPIPLVAVPTTAGTGSEVTPFAVFSDWEQQLKVTVSSPFLAPDVALVDPTLTYSLPARATAAAGIDVLAHAAEAYLSRQASPFSDALALQAAQLVGRHLRQAVAEGSHPSARRGMMEASLLAGIAFSHAGLGVTHAVAAAVSGQAHVPHGVAIGLLLPACLRFNQQAAPGRCARLAAALSGQAEPADALADAVAALAAAIGLPQRLSEVGVQPQHWPQIAADTMKSIQLQYNPRPVETADVLALLAELA